MASKLLGAIFGELLLEANSMYFGFRSLIHGGHVCWHSRPTWDSRKEKRTLQRPWARPNPTLCEGSSGRHCASNAVLYWE
jgi:hypothetical protein